MNELNVRIMLGQTLASVTISDDTEIVFATDAGTTYKLFHRTDCCESVYVYDVCGKLSDLVGSPLVESEEVSGYVGPEIDSPSYTWTFYKFRTANGCVTIRWLGESNGYYSESVDFCVVAD